MPDTLHQPAPGRPSHLAPDRIEAIVRAARLRFADEGYFAVDVADVAKDAEVAVADMYAAVGRKPALLVAVIERWGESLRPVPDLEELTTPTAILTQTVAERCRGWQEWDDVMHLVRVVAEHEPEVIPTLTAVTARYRAALAATARRLATFGALREGLDEKRAADVLWLHLGLPGWTAAAGVGWERHRAELWLDEQLRHALLPPGGASVARGGRNRPTGRAVVPRSCSISSVRDTSCQ